MITFCRHRSSTLRGVTTEAIVGQDVLAAAWQMADRLNHSVTDRPEDLRELQQLVDVHGPHELFRGHVMISGVLAKALANTCEDDVDPLLHLVPIPLKRFRDDDFAEIDPSVLPAVAAIVTAGMTGQDALGWVEQHMPEPTQAERMALVYLAWMLSTMFDDIYHEGAVNEIFGEPWR